MKYIPVVFLSLLSLSTVFAQTGKQANKQSAVKQKAAPQTVAPKKHKMTDTVGVINGTPILLYNYKDILGDIIRSAARDSIVSEDNFTVYVNAAWDKVIEDVLTEQEITKRKLHLSDSELLDQVIENPPDFLAKQFTNAQGEVQKKAMRVSLVDPTNDSIASIILGVERIRLEHERLLRAVASRASSDQEREEQLQAWLRQQKAKAKIIDYRPRFGFY